MDAGELAMRCESPNYLSSDRPLKGPELPGQGQAT